MSSRQAQKSQSSEVAAFVAAHNYLRQQDAEREDRRSRRHREKRRLKRLQRDHSRKTNTNIMMTTRTVSPTDRHRRTAPPTRINVFVNRPQSSRRRLSGARHHDGGGNKPTDDNDDATELIVPTRHHYHREHQHSRCCALPPTPRQHDSRRQPDIAFKTVQERYIGVKSRAEVEQHLPTTPDDFVFYYLEPEPTDSRDLPGDTLALYIAYTDGSNIRHSSVKRRKLDRQSTCKSYRLENDENKKFCSLAALNRYYSLNGFDNLYVHRDGIQKRHSVYSPPSVTTTSPQNTDATLSCSSRQAAPFAEIDSRGAQQSPCRSAPPSYVYHRDATLSCSSRQAAPFAEIDARGAQQSPCRSAPPSYVYHRGTRGTQSHGGHAINRPIVYRVKDEEQ